MKQSECSGSNCKGLLTSKWHRIKCFPFPTSRRKGLCSKWCNEGGTSTQPCYNAFHKYSSDQICFKNSDEKLNFEVVHCRSFEFNIRLESMVSSEYFPTLFLFDPVYFIFFTFSSFSSSSSHYDCYLYYYNCHRYYYYYYNLFEIITLLWFFHIGMLREEKAKKTISSLNSFCLKHKYNCLAMPVMYCVFAAPHQSTEAGGRQAYNRR